MTGTGEELSVLLYKNKLKSREDGGKRYPPLATLHEMEDVASVGKMGGDQETTGFASLILKLTAEGMGFRLREVHNLEMAE